MNGKQSSMNEQFFCVNVHIYMEVAFGLCWDFYLTILRSTSQNLFFFECTAGEAEVHETCKAIAQYQK